MSDTVIAADLGGTNLRMAVVTRDGELLHRTRRDTRRDATGVEMFEDIAKAAAECLAEARELEIGSFGIAVPATIDFTAGVLKSSPNLPALDGLHLPKLLSERLGMKVFLDNDATAAAVGECWIGATQGAKNSICITLGTGVGGGLILNGEPYRGIDGTAGEIGHIGVEREGHPCGCGSRGCVEQYASATALVRMTRELIATYPGSSLAPMTSISAADVFRAGSEGDALALKVFDTMGLYLGVALADLVNILNPEIIVIGGGVAGAWDLFIERTREEIIRRAFREPAERVKLVRAKLGDDAGILGAARLALSAAR
ncbi:MAG: ROK family protein [Acidobacteriota bacterium]